MPSKPVTKAPAAAQNRHSGRNGGQADFNQRDMTPVSCDCLYFSLSFSVAPYRSQERSRLGSKTVRASTSKLQISKLNGVMCPDAGKLCASLCARLGVIPDVAQQPAASQLRIRPNVQTRTAGTWIIRAQSHRHTTKSLRPKLEMIVRSSLLAHSSFANQLPTKASPTASEMWRLSSPLRWNSAL